MKEEHKVICLFKTTLINGNALVLNYHSADWDMPLFMNISLPVDEEKDHEEILTGIAARLNIRTENIELVFNRNDPHMKSTTTKKTRDKQKAVKYGKMATFNFYYCIVKISNPPDILRQNSFEVNGYEYKWFNLNKLKKNLIVKEYNSDVLEFLSTRFDSSLIQLDDCFPRQIFVICAFSIDMEPIFQGINSAGRRFECSVSRVKDIHGDYRITDKIIEMIHSADFIVADLTHERQNVYFELGYARGHGKNVITIARKGTPLHFDVKDWTCIFYDDSRELEEQLATRIEHEIKKKPVSN